MSARKRVNVGVAALALLLATTIGLGQAQEPPGGTPAQGRAARSIEDGYSLQADVASKFTYQGMLWDEDTPVNDVVDMVFRLYSDDACTTQVGSILANDVMVVDGVFSVELAVSQNWFYGLGVWIQPEVDGVGFSCQEILPVPYALSLRPGAIVGGNVEYGDVIRAVNTAPSNDSYGLYGQSYSNYNGVGVYGYASATSGPVYGVYGQTRSPSGAGVLAKGVDSNADLILGGNGDTGSEDDGVLTSDPSYASSDIVIKSNDTVRIDLDNEMGGEDADFEIRNASDTLIFDVDETGAVLLGGSGVPAFPRPAYDSGWVSVSQGGSVVRNHNLGWNVDNYVVDLTCMRSAGGAGINNWGVGGDANWEEYYGAWWSNLTTASITLHRWSDDSDCPQVRVRIWMYQ
ncbi:MAG: hypothetical protein PVI09_20450 [Anaerolineae bacterium]